MLFGQIEQMIVLHTAAAPYIGSLFITRAVAVTFKNGKSQLLGIDAQPFGTGQEFPAPGNHFLLEIVAQAPVAEHFKEG